VEKRLIRVSFKLVLGLLFLMPAGAIRIRFSTRFGLWAARSRAIWPPKEWPMTMVFFSFCLAINLAMNSVNSGMLELGGRFWVAPKLGRSRRV